jgi:hypothetical protein
MIGLFHLFETELVWVFDDFLRAQYLNSKFIDERSVWLNRRKTNRLLISRRRDQRVRNGSVDVSLGSQSCDLSLTLIVLSHSFNGRPSGDEVDPPDYFPIPGVIRKTNSPDGQPFALLYQDSQTLPGDTIELKKSSEPCGSSAQNEM